jgi:hypothetical protein
MGEGPVARLLLCLGEGGSGGVLALAAPSPSPFWAKILINHDLALDLLFQERSGPALNRLFSVGILGKYLKDISSNYLKDT